MTQEAPSSDSVPSISLVRRLERVSFPRAQAQIVAALYEAGNRWVDAGELNFATTEGQRIFDHAVDRDDGTMKVHVWRIRQAHGDEFILGSRYGWTLGAPAARLCRRLLANVCENCGGSGQEVFGDHKRLVEGPCWPCDGTGNTELSGSTGGDPCAAGLTPGGPLTLQPRASHDPR